MRENLISCLLWVAKGVSKSVPDQVKLSPSELKKLIQDTKDDIKEIEPDFKDDEDLDDEWEDMSDDSQDDEDEESKESGQEDSDESEDESDQKYSVEEQNESDQEDSEVSDGSNENEVKEEKSNPDVNDSDEDIISRYGLDDYDDSGDERPCRNIQDVVVHIDNKDDEYMKDYDSADEDEQEEEADFKIKEDDNLLVVGHVEGDSCTLDAYVYNKADDDFYVHHDNALSSLPIALEWMNFHPSGEEFGSYVAIGNVTPIIQVWDLDVVEANVPDYCLGEKLSKKKLKKSNLIGHKDAVNCLSWNRNLRYILASGSSDNSIILWNLLECKAIKFLNYHTGSVQALEWDPFDAHYLLSGCTDGLINLYDHKTDDDSAFRSWKVKGEIERVCWYKTQSSKFLCSTDQGFVYSFDINVLKPEHRIKAHVDNVTALDISLEYPNLLMTGGYDEFIKVWDLDQISKQPDLEPLYIQKTVVGKIFTAKFAPDSELVAAVGGECPSNNLKILDLGGLKPGADNEENAVPENSATVKQEESTPIVKNKKFKKKNSKLSGQPQFYTENSVVKKEKSTQPPPKRNLNNSNSFGKLPTHTVYSDDNGVIKQEGSTQKKKMKKSNFPGRNPTHIVYTENSAIKKEDTSSSPQKKNINNSFGKKPTHIVYSENNAVVKQESSSPKKKKLKKSHSSGQFPTQNVNFPRTPSTEPPQKQKNISSENPVAGTSSQAQFVTKKKKRKHNQIN